MLYQRQLTWRIGFIPLASSILSPKVGYLDCKSVNIEKDYGKTPNIHFVRRSISTVEIVEMGEPGIGIL